MQGGAKATKPTQSQPAKGTASSFAAAATQPVGGDAGDSDGEEDGLDISNEPDGEDKRPSSGVKGTGPAPPSATASAAAGGDGPSAASASGSGSSSFLGPSGLSTYALAMQLARGGRKAAAATGAGATSTTGNRPPGATPSHAGPAVRSATGDAGVGMFSAGRGLHDYLLKRPPTEADAAASASSVATSDEALSSAAADSLEIVLPDDDALGPALRFRRRQAAAAAAAADGRRGNSNRFGSSDEEDDESGAVGDDLDGSASNSYSRGEMYFLKLDNTALSSSYRGSSGSSGVGSGAAAAAADRARVRSSGSGLLSVPITTLLAQLDAESRVRTSAALARANKVLSGEGLSEEELRQMEGTAEASSEAYDAAAAAADGDSKSFVFDPHAIAAGSSSSGGGGGGAATSLWVDKYAPRTFLDLLSSDSLNRAVLRWVRQWDDKVFASDSSSGNSSKSRTGGKGGGFFGGSGSGSSVAVEQAAKRQRTAFASAATASKASSAASGDGEDDKEGGDNGKKLDADGKPIKQAPVTTGLNWPYGWRPESRMLLLAGGPGLGKTTLAHIIAKTAGYRALEINASDERSGKTLRERIYEAQYMAPAFGDSRPVMVIVDECDGLEGGQGGGVAELCKMIKATPLLLPADRQPQAGSGGSGGEKKKRDDDASDDSDDDGGASSSHAVGKGANAGKRGNRGKSSRPGGGDNDDDLSGGSGGGSKGGVYPLTRPVICICNDPYSPVLRELRPLVQLVEFTKTPTERLVTRLKQICQKEGLAVTSDALAYLAQLTDNDIRSCLNTLQYLRAQVASTAAGLHGSDAASFYGLKGDAASSGGGEMHASLRGRVRVTTDMLARASVGVKDQTKALHGVWEQVLTSADTRQRSNAAFVGLDGGEGAGAAASAAGAGASSSSSSSSTGNSELDAILAGLTADATKSSSRTGGGLSGALASQGSYSTAIARARASYFSSLHNTLTSYSSEPRLLLAGLHENLHSGSRVTDPSLSHTWKAMDWLCFGEEVTSKTGSAAGEW